MRKDEFYTQIELLLKIIIKIRDSRDHGPEDYEAIDFMYRFALACLKE